MRILANDGLSANGIEKLQSAGFEVLTTKVAQQQLANFINEQDVSVLLVRSATKVSKEVIDAAPGLKIIGRCGVGLDTIAVDYARQKGIHVFNTPAASSASVAELVFAHLAGGSRFLYDSNRNMPLEGDMNFKQLKKTYSQGKELRGKTLGIIGFGKVGREVAKIALGIGMKVIASDKVEGEALITLEFYNHQEIQIPIRTAPVDQLLEQSDFITVHVPAQREPVIGKAEFDRMKDGVAIINASRGGIIDEVALIEALENGKVSFAGLDTFENEPTPALRVLMDNKISLSPHIGASTVEAQERIGIEAAEKIIELLK